MCASRNWRNAAALTKSPPSSGAIYRDIKMFISLWILIPAVLIVIGLFREFIAMSRNLDELRRKTRDFEELEEELARTTSAYERAAAGLNHLSNLTLKQWRNADGYEEGTPAHALYEATHAAISFKHDDDGDYKNPPWDYVDPYR